MLRIYPIYWVVTALVLLLAVLRPGGAALPDARYLLASLLLLPQAQEPVLGVAWTLVHEMMFYMLFALAIVSRRLGMGVLALWLLLILAGGLTSSGVAVLRVLTAPLNLEFMMGIAVAQIALRDALPRPRLIAGGGALCFVAAGLAENAGLMAVAGPVGEALFSLASAGIVAGLATAERRGMLHVGRVGALLGDASYSLYLIHSVVIGLAARSLAALGLVRAIPPYGVFTLVAAAAVLVGLGLHLLVERPLLRWLGRTARL